MSFNQKKIQSNFNRFAKKYDILAILQKKVAKILVESSDLAIKNSKNILDLGCGTGFIGQNILKNHDFSQKKLFQLDISEEMLKNNKNIGENITNIQGNINNLNFEDNSFDLVISSLAFQWIDDLDAIFKKIKKILKPNANFAFSIFLDGTLDELKKSAKSTNVNLSVNNFIDLESLKIILAKNFKNPQIMVKDFILEYDDIYDLLGSMKNIGASYSSKKSSDISLKKADFTRLNKFYLNKFSNCDRIKASWKVCNINLINNFNDDPQTIS